MKFNFQRVKTPAYITSVALMVIGVLFALGSVAVAAWIFLILGLVLNVMAVSVTEITRAPRASAPEHSSVDSASRVVIEPEEDTEEHPVVTPRGSSAERAASGHADDASDRPQRTASGSTRLSR